jgi:hypothetical protein
MLAVGPPAAGSGVNLLPTIRHHRHHLAAVPSECWESVVSEAHHQAVGGPAQHGQAQVLAPFTRVPGLPSNGSQVLACS